MRYPKNIKEFKEVWNDPWAFDRLLRHVSKYVAFAALGLGLLLLLTGW